MITKDNIETERSPRGLRQFVTRRKSKINNCKQERHKGILKKEIYRVFVAEIIPLSLFCLKNYPNSYKILPKLGKQGFDAIVKDERGKIYEHLELTVPHYGKRTASDALLTVSRGYGNILIRDYKSGDDLNDMFSQIMEVCKKKSKKDYSDCSLVIVINFFPPFKKEEQVIEWLLRYSDDEGCQLFRKLYKGKISKIVERYIPFIMEDLKKHSSGDALMDRVCEIATVYHEKFLPVIESRGGLGAYPLDSEFLHGTVQITVKMAVMLHFLEHKYNHPLPKDLRVLFGK